MFFSFFVISEACSISLAQAIGILSYSPNRRAYLASADGLSISLKPRLFGLWNMMEGSDYLYSSEIGTLQRPSYPLNVCLTYKQ